MLKTYSVSNINIYIY